MSSVQLIELDTQPPTVIWDAPSEVRAGERLTVAFAASETLGSVTLTASGRALPLTVGSTSASGVLPVGWPAGLATLTATDEVGNAAAEHATVDVLAGSATSRGGRRRAPRRSAGVVHSTLTLQTRDAISSTVTTTGAPSIAAVDAIEGRARVVRHVGAASTAQVTGALRATVTPRLTSGSTAAAIALTVSAWQSSSVSQVASSARAAARVRDDEDFIVRLLFD
jgi:hypothetical protein